MRIDRRSRRKDQGRCVHRVPGGSSECNRKQNRNTLNLEEIFRNIECVHGANTDSVFGTMHRQQTDAAATETKDGVLRDPGGSSESNHKHTYKTKF